MEKYINNEALEGQLSGLLDLYKPESQESGALFLKSEPSCYVILMFYNWSRASDAPSPPILAPSFLQQKPPHCLQVV